MRTTLDIDEDVLETAKEIARKEKRTAGDVISEFARRGFYGRESFVAEAPQSYSIENGVPVLPPTGSLVTDASIRRLRDAEGI